LEFIVVPHNPVTQPAAGSDDQARYTDEGVEKALEFHANDGQTQRSSFTPVC